MPVFPSQDGPLHLYYVNAFRQLLTHTQGAYANAYTIKAYVTPYSSYYYGLIVLGKFLSLETANKLIVCVYLVLFAISTRVFLRTVTPQAQWAPFLVLPVLLNWPLMMGFINYSLSTCLAFFAFAAWSRGVGSSQSKYRVIFLLLIALMMITHPVPWIFVIGFACFDLAVRAIRSRLYTRGESQTFGFLRADVLTAVLAAAPYLYLQHFNGMVQTTEPEKFPPMPFQAHVPGAILPYVQRAQAFVRTFGLDIYAGNGALARFYRLGITALILAVIIAGCVEFMRRRSGEWKPAYTWLLFSACVLPFLLFLPDAIGNHFYFISRLGILFFLCCAAGASYSLQRLRRIGVALAAFSVIWWFLVFGMAVHYITPAAREIGTLQQAPSATVARSGLLMETAGSTSTPSLNFLPYYWAGANYFRQHNLLLYNTAWLGDPIIPLGVRPEKRNDLDPSYYESLPSFGNVMLPTAAAADARLRSVDLIVLLRQGANVSEHPLADRIGSTTPGVFALGWSCLRDPHAVWYLCERSGR